MRPFVKHAVLVPLIYLTLAGCGSSENPDSSASNEESATDKGGATQAGSEEGSPVTISGNEALTWGDGPYGVVLAHGAAFDAASWQDQAPAMADIGATVVAVEDISPEGINDAVTYLRDNGLEDVALVGGSAGADGILDLASSQPDLPDQLILLSPNSPVEGLGDEPKLFIASEDEPVADVSTQLADSSPGTNNKAILLPGSTHAQNIFDTAQGEAVLESMTERLSEFATS